jgi:hypothetical protein
MIPVFLKQSFGKASGFGSKYQTIANPIFDVRVETFSPGAEIQQPGVGQPGSKFSQILFPPDVHKGPVVEARPPHCAIVNPKSQIPDQMQRKRVGRAKARDISGVGMDLRLE